MRLVLFEWEWTAPLLSSFNNNLGLNMRRWIRDANWESTPCWRSSELVRFCHPVSHNFGTRRTKNTHHVSHKEVLNAWRSALCSEEAAIFCHVQPCVPIQDLHSQKQRGVEQCAIHCRWCAKRSTWTQSMESSSRRSLKMGLWLKCRSFWGASSSKKSKMWSSLMNHWMTKMHQTWSNLPFEVR